MINLALYYYLISTFTTFPKTTKSKRMQRQLRPFQQEPDSTDGFKVPSMITPAAFKRQPSIQAHFAQIPSKHKITLDCKKEAEQQLLQLMAMQSQQLKQLSAFNSSFDKSGVRSSVRINKILTGSPF